MRISLKVDYALRVLAELAARAGKVRTMAERYRSEERSRAEVRR